MVQVLNNVLESNLIDSQNDSILHIEDEKNRNYIILFIIFILGGCSMITFLLFCVIYVTYLYIYLKL